MHTLKLIPSIPILCLVYVFISDSQWTSCCVTCVCINIKNQFTWYIRGHSVFVGWVRDMLVCNGSLFLQFMVQDQQNPIMKTMLFVCLWFSFKILLGSRNPVLRFTLVEYPSNVNQIYIENVLSDILGLWWVQISTLLRPEDIILGFGSKAHKN